MVSDQFKRDYKAMTAQGVEFTPEDIVRLNALSVKVTLSARAADTVHLPRAAFIGKFILREPTIAHELWIEEASRWIDCRDDRNFLWVHGYALSRRAEDLPDATKPKKAIRAVYKFAAKELAKFTTAQLTAAVTYALVGNDWWAGEAGGEEKVKARGEGDDEVEGTGRGRQWNDSNSSVQPATCNLQPDVSPTIGLLVDAKALRLPLTVEEAKRMTSSELTEAINRCLAYDEKFDRERARNKAFGQYVRAREEIMRRWREGEGER